MGLSRCVYGFLSFLIAGALSGCAPDDGKCTIVTYGRMEVLNSVGSPIVRAAVNGHPVAFEVDSGAQFTMVDPQYSELLELGPRVGSSMGNGVGGSTLVSVSSIDKLDLGTSQAHNIAVIEGGHFNHKIGALPIVGLFGADFLANYEMMVDMPDHEVRLAKVRGCADPTPVWKGRSTKINIDREGGSSNMIGLSVKVNGHPVDAILDTGAQITLLSLSEAHHVGVTDAMLALDRVGTIRGVANNPRKSFIHRFDTLQVGDIVLHNVVFAVSDALSEQDMLLGADFLQHHRVWIKLWDDTGYIQHDKDIPADDPIRRRELD